MATPTPTGRHAVVPRTSTGRVDGAPDDGRRRAAEGLSLRDRLALLLEPRLDRALGPLFVRLYRLTKGRLARLYRVNALVLTTRGRRTGRERTVLLAYFPQGERFVVVGANGGQPRHPAWYLNLRSTPTARVEVGDRALPVLAEELSPTEAAAFWPEVVRALPGYARYPRVTSRTIPLVRLVPLEAGAGGLLRVRAGRGSRMRATTVLERPTATAPPSADGSVPPLTAPSVPAPARGLRRLLRQHPVLTYFALVIALSWGVLLPVMGGPLSASGNDRMANPLFLLAILSAPLAPTAASLLLTGLLDGRAGYRELLGRLRRWRVGWRWYAAALLAGPLPILLATAILAALLRSPAFLPSIFTARAPLVLVLLGVPVGLVAGTFEEVGWTGFAIPRLRRQHGLLATALPLGLVWGAWHFPAFWRADSFAGALPFALLLAQLFAWLPAYRVLLVATHDRTRSLPVVMLMHASLSASTVILAHPALSDTQSLATVLTWAALLWVAAGVVVITNRRQPAG